MKGRVVALVGAIVLGVAAAACGGGGGGGGSNVSSSGGGTSFAGAAALPAGTPAFIAVSTDLESDQWKQLLTLAHRFPGFETLLAKGRAELAKQGLDFEADVKPALGPEIDLAWVDFKSGDDFVLVTKPADPAKLDALLKKAKSPPARADVDGYVVLASKQASLDAVTAASGAHLSDDAGFKEAMSALPGGALVRAYVNGEQAQSALESTVAKSGPTLPNISSATKVEWLAAAASAQSTGIRLDGVAKVAPEPKLASFSSQLPDEFPAGALLYGSFANLDGPLRSLLKAVGQGSPSFQQQLGQLEAVAGFSLDKDVIPLFKNESGLAVYPSTQATPTIVFALKLDDEQKVAQMLDRIGTLLKLGNLGTVTSASVPGVTNAKQAKVGSVTLVYGTAGGKLLVSNRAEGLSDLTGSGPKLADDALFKAAKDDAQMPPETAGFVYANLKEGLPALLAFLQQGTKVPDAAKSNTEPLQSALLYATQDGSLIRIRGFAAIK